MPIITSKTINQSQKYELSTQVSVASYIDNTMSKSIILYMMNGSVFYHVYFNHKLLVSEPDFDKAIARYNLL